MSTIGADVVLKGVAKRYGTVTAVKPLDLVIPSGTLTTLLGPSGCGKTTLLRMIAGLEQVSEGQILIGGRNVTLMSAGERNVSMVFQSYALFPHMSVADNVAYGLVSGGMAKRLARGKAEETLATVGLRGFGERLPSQLSGGQQQRVAVARALVLEPSVLLFDEPLSNLDTRLRRAMREEIRALQKRLGLTVVYVTHDQSEAMAVSDTIVVMRNAEIAQTGTPEDLYRRPKNVFVATFMGEANAVKARIAEIDGARATIAIERARWTIANPGLSVGEADLVIRPEAIEVVEPGAGAIAAKVLKSTYMGSHTEYVLQTSLGELFCVSPDRTSRRPAGAIVDLRLSPEGTVLVAP